jgi:hypothetical protein
VREVETLRRRHEGAAATVVCPSPEIARLIRRPDQLFDVDRARECHALAHKQGAEFAVACGERRLAAA